MLSLVYWHTYIHLFQGFLCFHFSGRPVRKITLYVFLEYNFRSTFPHQSGKLLVCDAVFGLYMLDLEKVGESPGNIFWGPPYHWWQRWWWQWWWPGGGGEQNPTFSTAGESRIHSATSTKPWSWGKNSQGMVLKGSWWKNDPIRGPRPLRPRGRLGF